MNTTELVVEIRPEKIHVRTGFEPMTSAIPWRISYITYTLLHYYVSYIFTAVHIYYFHISTIVIHHLDGSFGPNLMTSSQLAC